MISEKVNQLLFDDVKDQAKIALICLTNTLFSILPVGYHMVVLNVPEKVIQDFYKNSFENVFGIVITTNGNSLLWSLTIALQGIGALFGCFFVPTFSQYGTKHVMMSLNSGILIVGSLMMTFSYWLSLPPIFMLGRFLTGIYTGIACAYVPLYLQEVAPANMKSTLSCFLHIAVCFGASIAAVLSLPFMLGSASTWNYLMGFPVVFGFHPLFLINFTLFPGICLLLAADYVPETPNFLLQSGQFTNAIESIRFYYEILNEDEEETVSEYRHLVPESHSQVTLRAALRDPATRRGILLGMVVSAAQIFSGSMVSISYSTNMFEAVSFMDSLIPFLPALGSIISIIMTIPAMKLVETYSRRLLLIRTLLLCIMSNLFFLIFTVLSQPDSIWTSWLFAIAYFTYGIGYNLGVGPVAYFLPAELVSREAASCSLGASVATNWICTILTTFFYYPLSVSIGGWSYLMFIVPTSIFVLIIWKFLPETVNSYKEDPLEIRLMNDLGTGYGTTERCGSPTLF